MGFLVGRREVSSRVEGRKIPRETIADRVGSCAYHRL